MKNAITFVLIFTNLISFSQTKVQFYTTLGEFTIQLEDSLAPITTGNFKSLVTENYYDGVIFHRVIDNFMIQGGQGSTAKPAIQDEFHDSLSNVQGTISMANAGPNTGTTQFFINLVDNTYLDFNKAPLTSKHPVFGKVIEGFSIVQDIGKVQTNASDKPLTDVVMDSVRFKKTNTLIFENEIKTEISIYPNPISENSVLYLKGFDKQVTVSIIQMDGRKLSEIKMVTNNNKLSNLIKHSLSKGIYLIKVSDQKRSEIRRVIVK